MEHLPEKRGALARALSQALAGGKHPTSHPHVSDDNDGPARALDDEQSFEQLVQTALSRTSRAAEERAAAPAHLAELLALPPHERDIVMVIDPRYQTYALAAYTLERCEKAVTYDPALARELARLARNIAMQADPRACGGAAALADLEAYALAMEGNALRVTGEFREAFQTFMEARQVEERGGADPDLGARIDFAEASLRRDLRQFGAALHLLDRAGKVFRSLKDRNQVARTLINRANVHIVQSEFAQAAATLEGALEFSCEASLALVVRHNLIDILAKSGRAQEASQLFEQSRDLYLQFSDPLTTSRRLWVEGIIAREIGEDLELAESRLTEAVERLTKSGYGFDAALAGLDLVTVYAARGQSAEVLRTAADLVHLFEARNVQPEALAALTMVYKAAQKETVSLALLAQVTELVRASQVLGSSAS
jgi:tetratricopeptide (TPR) repeat protein